MSKVRRGKKTIPGSAAGKASTDSRARFASREHAAQEQKGGCSSAIDAGIKIVGKDPHGKAYQEEGSLQ